MRHAAIPYLLAIAGILTACRATPREPSNPALARTASSTSTHVIHFAHQDAAQVANRARSRFGTPPMEATVEVRVDRETNSWVVLATPNDLARVEAIAAEWDHP